MNTKITLGVLTTLLPMTIFTAHASDTAVTNLNNRQFLTNNQDSWQKSKF